MTTSWQPLCDARNKDYICRSLHQSAESAIDPEEKRQVCEVGMQLKTKHNQRKNLADEGEGKNKVKAKGQLKRASRPALDDLTTE